MMKGRGVSLLAAVLVLLAGCSDPYAERALDDVTSELAAAGEPAPVVVWQPSEDVPAGTVTGATELSDGRTRLRVSAGGLTPVPRVVDVPEDEATATLEAVGLVVRRRAELARSGPFGVVVRTDPAADQLLDPGATVTVFVREEEREQLAVTLTLAVENDQLAAETLTTDRGDDSDDWTARGPSFAGERCWGDGFYSDIRDSSQFVVRNAAGTIVAKGELGRGRAAYVGDPDAELARDTAWNCVFRFTIADVPFSEFYAIETSRNTLTYAFDELTSLGWRLDLVLGDESTVGIEAGDGARA